MGDSILIWVTHFILFYFASHGETHFTGVLGGFPPNKGRLFNRRHTCQDSAASGAGLGLRPGGWFSDRLVFPEEVQHNSGAQIALRINPLFASLCSYRSIPSSLGGRCEGMDRLI